VRIGFVRREERGNVPYDVRNFLLLRRCVGVEEDEGEVWRKGKIEIEGNQTECKWK
jgi:hypothetical protein